jgi:hypothetical protein
MMHIPTHFMLSWTVGHRLPARRDRVLVAWAGIAPDLDGLSLLWGLDAYGQWHHVIGHGLLGALLTTVVCGFLGQDRMKVSLLAFAVFHLHLMCDLLGSGLEWPIQYWWPLSNAVYATPYGWELDSWQNWVIGVAALLWILRLGIRTGHTFAECFVTARLDHDIVQTLRNRFKWQGSSSSRPAAV